MLADCAAADRIAVVVGVAHDHVAFVGSPPSPLSRSITFHPRSLAHGPKPGYENLPVEPYLDMWAFMVDAAAPLDVTFSALDIQDESYRSMWL